MRGGVSFGKSTPARHIRLSKARSGSALQKAATSPMASTATTAKGLEASRLAAVILSPNFCVSRSWTALASIGLLDGLRGHGGTGQAARRLPLAPQHMVFLDLLLKLHDAVEQGLGPGRTAGNVYIHGHHLIHALEDVVTVAPIGASIVG